MNLNRGGTLKDTWILDRGMNTCRCRIIAVGKVRKGWVQEGVALYLKQLQACR